MILQYDLNGNYLEKFKSTKLAAIAIGRQPAGIHSCVTGRTKTAYGFKWKKVDERKATEEPKFSETDFERQLIESEIQVFRIQSAYKCNYYYEIFCFTEYQAQTISEELPKRFADYGWTASWEYDERNRFYTVKCRREVKQ